MLCLSQELDILGASRRLPLVAQINDQPSPLFVNVNTMKYPLLRLFLSVLAVVVSKNKKLLFVQCQSPSAAPMGPPVPPSPGFPPCSVCGPGKEVTLPDVVITPPQSQPVTCDAFQRAGQLGFVDPQFCAILPTIAAPCACDTVLSTSTIPTPNTTPAPNSPAPVVAMASPAPTPAPTPGTVVTPDVTPSPVMINVPNMPTASPVTSSATASSRGISDWSMVATGVLLLSSAIY